MQNHNSKFKILNFALSFLTLIFSFSIFSVAFAQDTSVKYNLIQPLPGVQSVSDFPTFISLFIPFLLGLAGLFALIQIVRGGIQRAVSGGNPSAVGEANDMIWQAILGLVLALSAYLILNTINPDLVNLKFAPLDIRIAPPIGPIENPEQKRPGLGQQCSIGIGCESPLECSVSTSPPTCKQSSVPNNEKPGLNQSCSPVIGCRTQTPALVCEQIGTGEDAFFECIERTQLLGQNQICNSQINLNGGCRPELRCKLTSLGRSTCQLP